jgi:hypothetical protein
MVALVLKVLLVCFAINLALLPRILHKIGKLENAIDHISMIIYSLIGTFFLSIALIFVWVSIFLLVFVFRMSSEDEFWEEVNNEISHRDM